MSVQKFIFPGLLCGILTVIGVASLLAVSPARVSSAAPEPAVQESSAALAAEAALAAGPAQAAAAPAVLECALSGSYPDVILQWCGLIERYSQANGVDPNIVSAVMLQESAGRPDAYSKSGAVGLMQVMPRDGKAASFMCKNGPCFSDRPSMNELFDPEYNVAYGAQMLGDLIRHHGELREALRAYGPMDVGYYYADLVMGIMNQHRE